jgi:hypothetical protein
MKMPTEAQPVNEASPDEHRISSVDFSGKLDTGEVLTGTPTVTEVMTTDLVITNPLVNSGILTINGASVAIGEGIQFKVDYAGATIRTKYIVKVVCGTDAGQTVAGQVYVDIN